MQLKILLFLNFFCALSFALPTYEPTGNKNIFFVETKSPANRIGVINHRQCCAIESASLANPDYSIYLFVFNVDNFEVNAYLKIVQSLPNVVIKKVDTENFVKGTPAEDLIKIGLKTKPEWLISHTSDVMRYVALSKYAGCYMDLDIISLKSLKEVSTINFAGMERGGPEIFLGSAVVGFGDDATGRKIANWLVHDVSANFSGNSWGANGLDTITRSVIKLCKTNLFANATLENCEGFKVCPQETFFAIPYQSNDLFFNENLFEQGKQMLENSTLTHLWNYLTWNKTVRKDSNALLTNLVKEYCPKVYSEIQEVY